VFNTELIFDCIAVDLKELLLPKVNCSEIMSICYVCVVIFDIARVFLFCPV